MGVLELEFSDARSVHDNGETNRQPGTTVGMESSFCGVDIGDPNVRCDVSAIGVACVCEIANASRLCHGTCCGSCCEFSAISIALQSFYCEAA